MKITPEDNRSDVRVQIRDCTSCCHADQRFGNSAPGWGETDKPLVMFLSHSPTVSRGNVVDTQCLQFFSKCIDGVEFYDWYFDHVIKCMVPRKSQASFSYVAENCWTHLKQQIEEIRPKNIVVFGYHACRALNVHYSPWKTSTCTILGIPMYTVTHFASAVYHGDDARDTYYEKFKQAIDGIRNEDTDRERCCQDYTKTDTPDGGEGNVRA